MKKCPICGSALEDGYCLLCGFDLYTDGDPVTGEEKKEKKSSLIDDLLDVFEEVDTSDPW